MRGPDYYKESHFLILYAVLNFHYCYIVYRGRLKFSGDSVCTKVKYEGMLALSL